MTRIESLRARLRERRLPACLVRHPVNVGYLTGFSGTTAQLIVTEARALLVTDSRYLVQVRAECPEFEVTTIAPGQPYEEKVAAEIRALDLERVALESEATTLRQAHELRKQLAGVRLEPADDLVAPLRRLKDADEIERIRHACALADAAFAHILPQVRPGVAERDLAIELEYFLKRQGAEREAFPTIVASGWRSALPHGVASERKIEAGDLVTFDFGARWRGYHSDVTRTVCVGHASDEQRRVYGVVLQAQEAAFGAIRPGAVGKAVDAAARDLIAAAGYGCNFGHSVGHSLGREVHDGFSLNARCEVVVEPGMVLTVEPGVYREGWGGVRVEENVVVTPDGCEILTRSRRDLIEV